MNDEKVGKVGSETETEESQVKKYSELMEQITNYSDKLMGSEERQQD